MNKRSLSITFLLFVSFFGGTLVHAQILSLEQATHSVKSDQRSFSELVMTLGLDEPLKERLYRFSTLETDSLVKHIVSDKNISHEMKPKAIYSIGFLMHGMRLRLAFNKIEWYDLPAAIETYKILLDALIYQKGYTSVIKPLTQQRSRLLTHCFESFPEYNDLLDLTKFKSLLTAPNDILKYLETNPGYRYFDSLLLHVAADDPVRLAGYLRHNETPLANTIRLNNNPYVKQIVSLSGDPDASELLPFIVQLADKKITRNEILKMRQDVKGYFQLMVNTIKSYHASEEKKVPDFHEALHKAIKEKSLSFYVNQLNEMHDLPKEKRFAPIQDLRMEDIYYIMISAGDELYTSSYLGLYRKLMEYCRRNATDSLFRNVHYDGFRDFIRIAANYNTIDDFFSCFAEETSTELLKRYIARIEEDTYTGLEKAMEVADCFAALSADSVFSSMARKELVRNAERCREQKLIFGSKLYDILVSVFNIVQHKKDSSHTLEAWTGYNEKLERKKLQNTRNEIIGLVLFFGDKDGKSSFNNFLRIFRDSNKWRIEDSPYWVKISSLSGQRVIFYANLPLDNKDNLDLQAQDSLSSFFKEQSIQPVILVHRGHSYYINYTMKRMEKSVQLAILGACGGNNYILDMATINPEVQMVISKKIGAMAINDPIIDEVAQTLVGQKDLLWREIWSRLENRFENDAAMLNLFKEYIPPPDNISIFVLNLFNQG